MTSRRRLTNKVDPKVLSHNLREVRIRKGLKQAQVADAVGMTRAGYHYIELGATLPSAQSLSKIAKVLGVRLKDLSKPIDPLKAVRFRVHKRMRDREVLLAKVGCWLKDYGELETALQ